MDKCIKNELGDCLCPKCNKKLMKSKLSSLSKKTDAGGGSFCYCPVCDKNCSCEEGAPQPVNTPHISHESTFPIVTSNPATTKKHKP